MASRMLWVTIMVVRLPSLMIRSLRSSTFLAVLGSSAAVCSSSSKSFGWRRVAISRVSACRCPPESRPTLADSLSSRPRSNMSSALRYSSRSLRVTPQESPRGLPRRLARARFSSMFISAQVPRMGS